MEEDGWRGITFVKGRGCLDGVDLKVIKGCRCRFLAIETCLSVPKMACTNAQNDKFVAGKMANRHGILLIISQNWPLNSENEHNI